MDADLVRAGSLLSEGAFPASLGNLLPLDSQQTRRHNAEGTKSQESERVTINMDRKRMDEGVLCSHVLEARRSGDHELFLLFFLLLASEQVHHHLYFHYNRNNLSLSLS